MRRSAPHQEREGARVRDARPAQCRTPLPGGVPDQIEDTCRCSRTWASPLSKAKRRKRALPTRTAPKTAPRRPRRAAAHGGAELAGNHERTSEPTDRTDDPVRMYLREMGSVELLSREGEIAIAKRIEAGRETMIAGLCESPLTFQAIIIWRDELNDAKILLRDIIDLEATYAGPDAEHAPPAGGESARGRASRSTGAAAPRRAGR